MLKSKFFDSKIEGFKNYINLKINAIKISVETKLKRKKV